MSVCVCVVVTVVLDAWSTATVPVCWTVLGIVTVELTPVAVTVTV